jgi:superoxide dismutase
MFWKLMAPGAGGAPSGALAQAITAAFGISSHGQGLETTLAQVIAATMKNATV